MKATAVESGNHHHSNVLGIRSQDSKVHKSKHKEEENEEIKAYLTKLQELVPFMPKNRKLSKLEVIQYVIDYIRDLRQTLGLPQARLGSLDLSVDPMEMMTSVMSSNNTSSNNNTSSPSSNNNNSNTNNNNVILPPSSQSHPSQPRQPLVSISTPNNSSLNGSCASQEIPLAQTLDKSDDSTSTSVSV